MISEPILPPLSCNLISAVVAGESLGRRGRIPPSGQSEIGGKFGREKRYGGILGVEVCWICWEGGLVCFALYSTRRFQT